MSNGNDTPPPRQGSMNGTHASPTGADRREASRSAPPSYAWLATAGAGLVVSVLAIVLGSPALAELWLLVFVVLAGFGAASLGLLMIGHLLGETWLEPVRDELEPASWTMPLLAILALPLAFGLDALFPWADQRPAPGVPTLRDVWLTPAFFLIRSAAYIGIWTWLAVAVTRAGSHRGLSAAGLALLAATFSLASVDWVLSREPAWWSSLGAFALSVNQLLAALAAAILVTTARQGHPESEALESLERTLLTFALLSLWVWFSQYLVVWMGNLPEEAAWLLARLGDTGAVTAAVTAAVLGTLVAAIVLLIPSRLRRWRVLSACVLILVHHIGYMVWLFRPVRASALGLGEAALLAGMIAVWAAWLWLGLARHGSVVGRLSGPGGAER